MPNRRQTKRRNQRQQRRRSMRGGDEGDKALEEINDKLKRIEGMLEDIDAAVKNGDVKDGVDNALEENGDDDDEMKGPAENGDEMKGPAENGSASASAPAPLAENGEEVESANGVVEEENKTEGGRRRSRKHRKQRKQKSQRRQRRHRR